jgi:hypothetical protein
MEIIVDFYQTDSIYKNKKDPTETSKAEFFTVLGEEEFLADDYPQRKQEDNQVYAKKIQKRDGMYKYVIKLSNNGKLYNPISVLGEEKTFTFLDKICRSNNRFKTVNEKAFNWYIQFLRSKNLAWFYNAEREMD